MAAVAYHRVLHHPRRRLNHRGHRRSHHQVSPRGQAAGDRRLKFRTDQYRGGDVGGGRTGGAYLFRPPSEHCITVYHDKDNYGTVSGGGGAFASSGTKTVVGIGGTRSFLRTKKRIGSDP